MYNIFSKRKGHKKQVKRVWCIVIWSEAESTHTAHILFGEPFAGS